MQNSFVFPHGEMVLDYYYHHHHFHTYHLQNHHLTVKASSFSDFTHCGNNNNNKNINNNNNSKEGNKYNNNNKSYIKYSNNNNNSFCKIVKNNVNNTSKTLNKHLNSNLATFLANSNPNIIYNENKNNNKNNNYNETNNSNTNNMVNKNTILKAPKIVISSSSYQNNNYSDNNISKNININTNTNRYHHRNHHLLRHHHHHLVSSLERGRCRKKDLTYIVLETSINNDNEKNDNKNNSIDNINKKSNNNSNTNNNNNKDNNDCLNTLTCSFFCGNRNKNNVKSLQNDAKAEICIKATPYNNNNNNNEKIHNKNINTKEIEESKGNTITKELKAISPDKLASLIIDQGATTWANDNLSNGVSKITLHDVTEEGSPESIKGQQEKSIQHYQFSQLNQQHSIKSNTQQNSLPPTPPNPKQAPPSPHHILLDCRTFFHYNTNHIVSSFNLSCSDCISRKRLKNGKIDVIDLISGPKDAKSIFKRIFSRHNHQPMIVLYDNDTDDVSEVNPNHPFVLVFNSLRKLTPNVLYLAGGIKHFQQKHQHLCVHNLSHPSDPIQLSSSSSSSTNDIDNATISILLPFLYIGNEQDSLNQALLQKEGITHILNVTRHIQMPIQHLTYLRLPALDNGGQNLKQYFEMAYKFIEDARMKGGKVLVHCQAGVSRSASIAMSYLMQKYRMPMMQAFKWVKSIRPIVAPNFNFLGQLLELEGKLGYTPIPNSSSSFSSSSYSSSSSSGVSSSGVSSSSSQNKLWHDVFRDLNVNDDDDDDDDEDDEGFVNGSSSCGGDDDSKSSLKVLGDNNKNNNKKKNNNFNTNRKNTR